MQPILTVNGHEVSREEFRWFMEQERAGVLRRFQAGQDLEGGKDLRTREVGGTTPRAMLQTNAVARIVREKIEQILFLELGLVQDIRYAALLTQLEKLNQAREQAARLGQTVYGPVRYTQLQFYGHWKATLRAQATERLAEKRWPPSEESLKKFYNERRDLFQALPLWTLAVLILQPKSEPAGAKQAEAVEKAARTVLARFKAGDTLADVLKERLEDATVGISGGLFRDINADRITELFPQETSARSVLALAPGESVLLAGPDAAAKVVRCDGRVERGPRPYEAVRSRARELWLAEQYDRHIKDLARQAKVQVQQEALDTLCQ